MTGAHESKLEVLGEGKFLRLLRRGRWEFCDRHSSDGVVGIIGTTDAGELVLVEQWREAVGARCIELPAGLVGDEGEAGESSVKAAERELLEETGYVGKRATRVVEAGCSSAGLTGETVDLVRIEGLERQSEGGGVAGEEIEVHVVPLGEVEAFLARKMRGGRRVDLKVWAALWFCRPTTPASDRPADGPR